MYEDRLIQLCRLDQEKKGLLHAGNEEEETNDSINA